MSKHLIFLIIASLVVAVVTTLLLGEPVLGPAATGAVVGRALGAVGIAIVIALIPAGIYWLFKRKRMPGLTVCIWVLWALVALAGLVGNLAQR